jgi:hypothetical protein
MDPDERLTELLRGELRRSLAEMRLDPELRQQLKVQLLATPASRWPGWLRTRTGGLRRSVLTGVAGLAVAGLAAAVVLPLVGQHPSASSSRQYLAVVPPGVSAGGSHSAAVAPASCGSGSLRLHVAPRQISLAQGQAGQLSINELHGACAPTVSVTGPVAAVLTVRSRSPSSSNPGGVIEAKYTITWTGHTRSGGTDPPGKYQVTVSVPASHALATATITVRR